MFRGMIGGMSDVLEKARAAEHRPRSVLRDPLAGWRGLPVQVEGDPVWHEGQPRWRDGKEYPGWRCGKGWAPVHPIILAADLYAQGLAEEGSIEVTCKDCLGADERRAAGHAVPLGLQLALL